MIKVQDLSFRYSPNDAPGLGPLNLEIQPAEYVAIIGPNGCGKTTLVKHFNALLIPTDGKVWVDEMDISDSHHWTEIRQTVGMVFQNPDHQILAMTVEEDVAFGPGNLGFSSAEIQARVTQSLETVGMVGHAQRPPHTLSGGERRLIAIAGVLAMNPRYIVFDEPTSDLDPMGREMVLETVGTLNRQGIAIIHITHNMDEIAGAKRVVVMEAGRVVLQGTPREVFRHVERLKRLRLDVPPVTELMWRLHQVRGDVRLDILTIDEALREILALLSRRQPASDSGGEEKANDRL